MATIIPISTQSTTGMSPVGVTLVAMAGELVLIGFHQAFDETGESLPPLVTARDSNNNIIPITLINTVSDADLLTLALYFIVPTDSTYEIRATSPEQSQIVLSATNFAGVNLSAPIAESAVVPNTIEPAITLPAVGDNSSQRIVDLVSALPGVPIIPADDTATSTLYQQQSASLNGAGFTLVNNLADRVYVAVEGATEVNGIAIALNPAIVCVARNTLVTMADGSLKPVQEIKRGDRVFTNLEMTTVETVAQLNITYLGADEKPNIVTIRKNSLGPGLPFQELKLTDPHPLIIDGVRRPARCFINFPGVSQSQQSIPVKELLPTEPDHTYAIYDLVFDHDTNYIANGVLTQAHSPYCHVGFLPKESYFNPKNYKEERSWHCLNHPLPWDDTILPKPQTK